MQINIDFIDEITITIDHPSNDQKPPPSIMICNLEPTAICIKIDITDESIKVQVIVLIHRLSQTTAMIIPPTADFISVRFRQILTDIPSKRTRITIYFNRSREAERPISDIIHRTQIIVNITLTIRSRSLNRATTYRT